MGAGRPHPTAAMEACMKPGTAVKRAVAALGVAAFLAGTVAVAGTVGGSTSAEPRWSKSGTNLAEPRWSKSGTGF